MRYFAVQPMYGTEIHGPYDITVYGDNMSEVRRKLREQLDLHANDTRVGPATYYLQEEINPNVSQVVPVMRGYKEPGYEL